ncbi:coproporphyrinogen III oxidase family protein [Reinekea blandensis]|uniref:Coproporphyrinogen III oxidase n=1 Tax=Reinekea blandensis MED297 TaxID=314283 RepID=A4BCS4_9GAMM|nr:coproporphyrinogen III oxidase family protein [Reinekea blandensis]EAR10006.1 coproporphyrinogen III oxidase [Reinekea sp. MED297] [Reinekea blandensis MED297]
MQALARYPLTQWATHRLFRSRLHLDPQPVRLPSVLPTPVALYLHIPFCESLCTYCSFHRQLLDPALAKAYFQALRQQITAVAEAGWQVSQVYIGGGTPTVLPQELASTLSLLTEHFGLVPISVETNPNHLTTDVIEMLSARDVSRLSIGVQSFDDDLLQKMNRRLAYGDSEAIQERLAWVNRRFPTVNVDLIFNLPGQSERSLRRDLAIVNALQLSQVSWYPLMPNDSVQGTLEASLGRWQRKTEWKGFKAIRRALSAQYQPSSAWCYNLGHQPQSDEYFVNSPDYLGLGSGSFSFIDRTLYASSFHIPEYIGHMQTRPLTMNAQQTFSDLEWMQYRLMMQLFALHVSDAPQADGWQHRLWQSELSALKTMRAIQPSDQGFEVTPLGQYLGLVLMREFFVAVNRLREQMSVSD